MACSRCRAPSFLPRGRRSAARPPPLHPAFLNVALPPHMRRVLLSRSSFGLPTADSAHTTPRRRFSAVGTPPPRPRARAIVLPLPSPTHLAPHLHLRLRLRPHHLARPRPAGAPRSARWIAGGSTGTRHGGRSASATKAWTRQRLGDMPSGSPTCATTRGIRS